MPEASVISVNSGLPRPAEWQGRPVMTAIFKQPVAGRVAVRFLNIDGDRQADLTVHGGPDKAIYVYPSEYYEFWRQELGQPDLPWGSFGENFTTSGLVDDTVNIGDHFSIGTAEVVVTQPRVPCYKLNIKFGRPDMVRRFARSRFTGFYLAVVQEGEAGAGDVITRLQQDPVGLKVSDVSRLYFEDRADLATMRRARQVPALADVWKSYFAERLARLEQ